MLPNNKESDLVNLVKQRFVDLTFKDKVRLFRKYNELEGFATNVDVIDYLFQCLFIIQKIPKFRSLSLYVIVTILAYLHEGNFLYSLLLLDIVSFEAYMKDIVKSITLNASQFLMSAVFAFLVIYLFSFIAFEVF